jgi:dihydroorotase
MSDPRFGRLSDPPASLLLEGIRVVDPGGVSDRRDLAVHAGRIVDPATAPADAERIDGRALAVAPGFCDVHTHLREPGDPAAETVASGTRAAARGGFTTVCAMPNTEPALDRADRLATVLGAAGEGSARVRIVAAATRDRAGVQPTDLDAIADRIVAVSDDGAAVPDAALGDLCAALARLGLPLIEHAEDPTLAAGAVMRAGPTATRLGLAGWPPRAERAVVERDLSVAERYGARVHLTHLSTAAAIEAVRGARDRGVAVTCDVTPHHLALTDAWVAGSRAFAWEDFDEPVDECLAYDGRCRVNPPLPSRDDALALLAAVADGTVDAIATDHAPHPPERKLVPFGDAAPGLVGLETAFSLGLAAVAAGRLTLERLVDALSVRPARIIGEDRGLREGSVADLVVFDPDARWRVDAGELASASANTPLLGRELPGVVRLTVADGRVTYRA